ncbi:sensor histidine kinase [Micromonospora craniellae]|uniref:histidine kinase n=1 Tax=Micromonospora craniellae TaxID=2294034 RepID=A0A372FUC0_9ACTN|nr:sensor domain-containing protein [Micromonospora craniellae]QOC92223.1 sensor domain-containing protein [Micromonospora craniellae]RFS44343.1 sensor histidine kinase [Micromonospora craniellae]
MATHLAHSFAARRRLLGWACVLIALAFVEVLVLTWVLTTLTLAALWVTLPLFTGAVLAARAMADSRRLFVARELGIVVGRRYRPLPASGRWARFNIALRDPATWRDARWLLVDTTAGVALLSVPVAAFLAGVLGLVLPLIWSTLPAGASLDFPFGTTIHDTGSAAANGIPWGLFYLGFCWLITPVFMHWYGELTAAMLRPDRRLLLAERIDQLATTRTQAVDAQAQELRRIERDLHDGTQAHLVALGMSLGMVENLIGDDPAVRQLLAAARTHNAQAIAELRALIKGIRPPVLGDRGLVGAVESLAMRMPLRIDVDLDLPGRLSDPVEAAAYFTISEALANTVKHSGASRAWVRGRQENDRMLLEVGDDGRGGAVLVPGGGLEGVRQRLAAFDGTLTIAEPATGGTTLTIALPIVAEPLPGGTDTGLPMSPPTVRDRPVDRAGR